MIPIGKLIFTYSTMKAGKSLDLIIVHYNYSQDTDKKVAIIKPTLDSRDGGFVKSRNGNHIPVTFRFKKEDRITDKIEVFDFDVILVDEAQFLTKSQVQELHKLANVDNKIVMCWGLRIDYQNEGFEGSQALLTYANEIREIKTVCTCGKKATHHLLYDSKGNLIVNGNQVVIGDSEYKSVCSNCYYNSVNEVFKHW